LTCGANTHDRLVTMLSKYADTPVLVMNYRMIPKHSIGEAIHYCYDGYRWLRGRGYRPDQIVLGGDSAGGYLSLALAQRLLAEGEEPAAIVCMSPLMQLAKAPKQAHPNIRSDAMFSAKVFDAFVDLVARAANGRSEEIYEPLDHIQGRSAPHVDPCVRFRGPAARRSAGRGRSTGPAAGVAWPDARVPDRPADGARSQRVIAPDWKLHPRSDRHVPPRDGLYRRRPRTGISPRRHLRFRLKPVAAVHNSPSNWR
jgi:acetyl esterase/lipase